MTLPGKTTGRVATSNAHFLRTEALRMLEGYGLILDTARDLSRLFQERGIAAVVIGGVAVVLHGHVRTTVDVDVLTLPPPEVVAKVLVEAGYEFNAVKKEFRRLVRAIQQEQETS